MEPQHLPDEKSQLFTPYRLGGVTLRNRTIRSAAFESMGRDFSPTEQLKQRKNSGYQQLNQ